MKLISPILLERVGLFCNKLNTTMKTIDTIMDSLILMAPDGEENIPKQKKQHPLLGKRCHSRKGGNYKQAVVYKVDEEGVYVRFSSGNTAKITMERWKRFWTTIEL